MVIFLNQNILIPKMKKSLTADDGFHPLKKHLRMGFIRLFILWQIRKGETHGYDLMKKVVEHIRCHTGKSPAKTSCVNGIGTGEIYSILDSLEAQGYIKSEWTLTDGKPKKNYVITEKGVQALRQAEDIVSDAIKDFEVLFPDIASGFRKKK